MPALLRELTASAALLLGVGLVAIGASGVIALAMRAGLGDRFVAGDPVGITYTASRCAEFREYHPEAATCEEAASAHHADEVVWYRIAAGVLGIGVVGARWWWDRRRARRRDDTPLLPDGFSATVGASLFGASGGLLLAQGLGQLVAEGSSHGPGQWISGGVVAIVVAAAFGWHLLQTIRSRAGRV